MGIAMHKANSAILMLLIAGFFAASLRWPVQPLPIRLVLGIFTLLCLVANWLWTIGLPVARDLGLAIDMMSLLLLLTVMILTLRKGRADPEAGELQGR